MSAHPRLGRNSLKLLNLRRDIPELPRKRRQIARKNVLRVQVRRHHTTQRTQLIKPVAKRRRNRRRGSLIALPDHLDRGQLFLPSQHAHPLHKTKRSPVTRINRARE